MSRPTPSPRQEPEGPRAATAAATAAATSTSSSSHLANVSAMASSQNLPAVLNDPKKGKQRDFFMRSWGDSFSDTRPIPPSPHVCELPPKSFDRYLKKIRRHELRQKSLKSVPADNSSAASASASTSASPLIGGSGSLFRPGSNVSRTFLEPSFDLTKPETFSAIFPFAQDKNFPQQVETSGRLMQEKLSHQLDVVEESIAHQVAQKSHNFFQVMTYHNALMTQLKTLVKVVQTLRAKLHSVDETSIKPSLDICRLKRRRDNGNKVIDKLSLMSFLHQTQPTIQLLLTSSEFSGALDLITTSCEILSVDLKGIVSFRHLTSQLHEIQTIIGRILLEDFESFISSEIGKETIHIKATAISGRESWNEFNTEQLTSVIFGLLRQNSLTFLEVLEDASVAAVKTTMCEVVQNVYSAASTSEATTVTNLVMEFARSANSEQWIDLFDILIGSLIALLSRIHVIHTVIRQAIESTTLANQRPAGEEQRTNGEELEEEEEEEEGDQPIVLVSAPADSGNGNSNNNAPVLIPQEKLQSLLSNNRECLINVCEQMHERCAKLLTQRSKAGASSKISVQELTSLGLLVSIFTEESFKMTGKQVAGLQLSLQSQTVLYVQSFHEDHRQTLSGILDKESWKKCSADFSPYYARLGAVPSLSKLFEQQQQQPAKLLNNNSVAKIANGSNGTTNGVTMAENGDGGGSSDHPDDSDGAASPRPPPATATPTATPTKGLFCLSDESFAVTESIPAFLKLLVEYCNLCTLLPSVTVELGLKTAELIKFLNSRVCQLVLGLGSISVSGLKTITIRNLALVMRGLQLVVRIIPHVLLHFQTCYLERSSSARQTLAHGPHSPNATKAESKQFEVLQRQFDQAVKHLKNHVDELYQKILAVVDGILQQQLGSWQAPGPKQQQQLPGPNFKALCKQLAKLHESTLDVWPEDATRRLFERVHARFLEAVRAEIRARGGAFACDPAGSAQARALQSELAFYGQSMLRLRVLPREREHELERARFEALWDEL